MDYTLKFFCSVALITALSFSPVSAGHGNFDINVRFQKLNIEQGLSQEVVQSIYQDEEGYLWFGTQEGLNRYDGYNFEVFNQEYGNENALPEDWIFDIQEDASGNLWVATDGGGVAMFDEPEHAFIAYQHDSDDPHSLSSNTVRVLFLDSSGRFWIGTENGLDEYHPDSKQFESINIAPTPSSEFSGELQVRAITEDANGLLWIGTDGSGLYSYNPQTGNVAHYFSAQENNIIHSDRISSLLVDSENRLWAGTYDKGIALINPSRNQADFYQAEPGEASSLSHNQIRDILEDNQGTIWLATDNGLDRWLSDAQAFAHYRHSVENPFSLSSSKINTIYQDRGNVLWVGTFGGINKWNTATAVFRHMFKQSDSDGSLTDNGVNAFAQSDDGTLWVGTYGGLNGLHETDREVTVYTAGGRSDSPKFLNDDRVMSLYSASSGHLWIGTRAAGLSKLNLATGKLEHYSKQGDSDVSLSSDAITKIVGQENGELLIGTWGGGLNRFNPQTETFTHFRADPYNGGSLSSDKVPEIYITQDKKIWVGTWDGGITVFNPDFSVHKVLRMGLEPGQLSEDKVWSILEDSNHNIWVGTQGGGISLLRAENRELGEYEFERIGRSQGLPSMVVYGLLEADDGSVWGSTNRGISKINPNDLSILNYDADDGLQSNDFNSGAYFKGEDGWVYFGGSNGVTAFHPARVQPNSHVPPVVITEYATINERSPLSDRLEEIDKIEVAHEDYLVSFSFAALDFAEPQKNQYAYMLEGFDREWLYTNDIRKATYTNLPDGNYVFKVKAANNDGLWNEDGASIKVKVLPPVWRTWWAYTLYGIVGLLLLTVLILAYRRKLKRARLYHQELENEVGRRTKELTDLNEQLYTANTSDSLSGLKNRIYLLSILEKEVADIQRQIFKAKKEGNPDLSVGPRVFFLMIDLDKFRAFNEKNDKRTGDKVIQEVGELLSDFFRTSDTVVRWGGDQFLVVGQVDDVREVNRIADRLQQRIKSHPFKNKKGSTCSITCSLGFSLYPFYPSQPEAMDWQHVQKIASQAMLISKRVGRDTWTGVREGQGALTDEDIESMNKNYKALAKAEKINVVEFHSYAKRLF
ncbi:diguanylate cyclase [Alteromonas sp. ASW11-19]|uniref:Diguanylate cyclase n=1 Tax=Alteromonas salexigens TaxID=2982530 RepID=A0ABT2VPX6_9ALTE|nr:ligand-binding sensor domain-containing diguanylate cyclase [Alteromonas salexigens]MCU7555366.1 diguanylate cyclase [Alteromonas salexigens]